MMGVAKRIRRVRRGLREIPKVNILLKMTIAQRQISQQ
jgi:hypothetical protein